MRTGTPAEATAANHSWPFIVCGPSSVQALLVDLPASFCQKRLVFLSLRHYWLLKSVAVAGNLSRTCTDKGWSDVYPSVVVACWSDKVGEPSEVSLPPLRGRCLSVSVNRTTMSRSALKKQLQFKVIQLYLNGFCYANSSSPIL